MLERFQEKNDFELLKGGNGWKEDDELSGWMKRWMGKWMERRTNRKMKMDTMKRMTNEKLNAKEVGNILNKNEKL